jgi:hypothetical protein
MARYRAALDAGGDPEEIGKWIADAKASSSPTWLTIFSSALAQRSDLLVPGSGKLRLLH